MLDLLRRRLAEYVLVVEDLIPQHLVLEQVLFEALRVLQPRVPDGTQLHHLHPGGKDQRRLRLEEVVSQGIYRGDHQGFRVSAERVLIEWGGIIEIYSSNNKPREAQA